ncbi:tight junction protein ZO-1-like isoform X1 [Lates japonicus]|uniref:Tight junction protein ZO-1-like isoform X1 n=1 Tax=Lates japonicus TaxID=270547 RepID=A0AAD3M4T3_LATJO|nr:tight junction protein ZO-1-like isoform X1 [Lates japonicus]
MDSDWPATSLKDISPEPRCQRWKHPGGDVVLKPIVEMRIDIQTRAMSTPVKSSDDGALPQASHQASSRDDKQLPPLPGTSMKLVKFKKGRVLCLRLAGGNDVGIFVAGVLRTVLRPRRDWRRETRFSGHAYTPSL